MSVSIDVYLPTFSLDTVRKALAILADHNLHFKLDESLESEPNLWQGFTPMNVKISGLNRSASINQQFETGFEVYVSMLQAKKRDLAWAENSEELKSKVARCTKIVKLTASPGVIASFAISNCFAAALTEAGGGILIDCQSGEFDYEIQNIGSVLHSDLVNEFDEIDPIEFPWSLQ